MSKETTNKQAQAQAQDVAQAQDMAQDVAQDVAQDNVMYPLAKVNADLTLDATMTVVARIDEVHERMQNGYLDMACDMAYIKNHNGHKTMGYRNIYEFAKDRYGMSRGTTNGVLQTFDYFGSITEDGYILDHNAYKLGASKCVILLSLRNTVEGDVTYLKMLQEHYDADGKDLFDKIAEERRDDFKKVCTDIAKTIKGIEDNGQDNGKTEGQTEGQTEDIKVAMMIPYSRKEFMDIATDLGIDLNKVGKYQAIQIVIVD